ncbi:MAG: hypothetical protein CVU84_13485 [Firmicutes bacterium HGW-Firmicutes-1]|jgi:murein DD-endopeptidase MepM/ murein hydrolase activator NlpD|nr:MAG: hypothetical protein CVU84_13485 [Firmicutes bacterium HGW-Firmicutes-1]
MKIRISKVISLSLLLILLTTQLSFAISTNSKVGYSDILAITSYAKFSTPFRSSSSGPQVDTYVVNEKFAQMRLSRNDTHQGIDFSCPRNTPIYSVYSGTVKIVNTSNADVKFVIIQHDYDTSSNTRYIYSVYVHMNTIAVKAGDYVYQGQLIGNSGPPTSNVYGYHLHFGLTSNYSSNYQSLVWVPTYNLYKTSSLYLNGQDFDYMYGYNYSSSTHEVSINGYYKPNSTLNRYKLDTTTLYYRSFGSSSNWTGVNMPRISSTGYGFKYDLDNLPLTTGQRIEYFFVGAINATVTDPGQHWQYFPAKYIVPPSNPNPPSSTWLYSKYAFTK